MRGKGRGHVIAFPFMSNGSPSAPMGLLEALLLNASR